MPSFYTPELTTNSKQITISGSEHHHITRVFRLNEGKEINLNSGTGVYAHAKIIEVTKKELICEVLKFIPKEKYLPKIAVAFSLLRNKNDLLLVEKLTELGVAELFPFESAYSVRKASNNTTDKFLTTAIEAIKQCDNAYLPLINTTQSLNNQLKLIEEKSYTIIVASEIEQSKTLKELFSGKIEKDICIIIGPEGGFSKQEFNCFIEQNYLQFKLGLNILRAETAAICAVSQVISFLL